jgi:uncharacterized protein with FMN-binding domain
MPRRGAIALILTAAGLILLLTFRTPDLPIVAGGRRAGNVAAAQGPGAIVGQANPGSANSPAPTNGPGSTSVPATKKPTGGTIDGPVVQTRYGDVQVEVKLNGNRLTDVVPLALPIDRARSALISQYAEPILRSEALQAQSAQIDLVSGATYTSEGYAQSLQAALDRANG